MNGFEWRKIQHDFHIISTTFAITFNIFLIILISTRSPKTIRSYKYLLMGVSIFEIFFSSVEIIATPIVHSFHTIVVVLTVVGDWPRLLMRILTSTYCGSFGCFLAMFAMLFVYRYYVVSGNSKVKYFESWYLVPLAAIVLFCGFIWGAIGYLMFGPSEEIDEFIRLDLYEELGLHPENIAYVAPHFYLINEAGEKVWNWDCIIGMSGVCTIVNITVFFIFRYGIKTYRFLQKMSIKPNISEKARTMQKQLFYALVIQASVPLVLLQLPLVILFIFSLLNIHLGQIAGIHTFTISLFPAVDPLPTIFVIKAYRLTILGRDAAENV
ncbi:Protein CBG01425 [Caenorhabditis briggsae]|uniref:Protein CBG01425 n=1 Tax=Caenorhabditis briggsae TaxID=6238 RepID=A8WQE0_CAEBR|nr:Protein CBG01425 [Caenorhabditis briggsae]CAP22698.1 Protein CBG01425 [Caenorhabditis briggsae]